MGAQPSRRSARLRNRASRTLSLLSLVSTPGSLVQQRSSSLTLSFTRSQQSPVHRPGTHSRVRDRLQRTVKLCIQNTGSWESGHACDPTTQEAEPGALQVPGEPGQWSQILLK